MIYALLGDLHSSKEDTLAVLNDIQSFAPNAKVIGLGDLFECVIGKKRAATERFNNLKDVIIRPDGFEQLLTFSSVTGNQEVRIVKITTSDDPLMDKFVGLPEEIELEGAIVTHGHEWSWSGDPWTPVVPNFEEKVVFFGHSHHSKYCEDGKWLPSKFKTPIKMTGNRYAVNVGSVIDNREWVLYDSEEKTFTFYQAE
jgi:predicted phosphodiesterase